MAVFHTIKIKLQLAPNILLKVISTLERAAVTEAWANKIFTWMTQRIKQFV